LKLPVNLVLTTKSYADFVNLNIFPLEILYKWLRKTVSYSETPELNLYG